jgi:hypothetical protein
MNIIHELFKKIHELFMIISQPLATVPPALFQDDGNMSKSQKSQLAKHIQLDADITSQEVQGPLVKLYDGCALLHRISFQTVDTFFLAFVTNQGSSVSPVTVVFDSYNVLTTKDQEQKRRRMMKP